MKEQRTRYNITNWSEYNKSLVHRGKITLWLEDDLEKKWHCEVGSSKRGRPFVYSDMAMELCLTLKVVYSLSYRSAQGFTESLFSLGKIKLKVPSYTQVSRRAQDLDIPLKHQSSHSGPIDIVVDSTGLKVYGEGEWKVRQHGLSKRRTWKKLHLGVDPLSHEVYAHLLTEKEVLDDQAFVPLLAKIKSPIERCAADGAYDRKPCYKTCHDRQTELIVPPRRNAILPPPDKMEAYLIPRNQAIERIAKLSEKSAEAELGRKEWKVEKDYHIRSIAENAMYRFKTLCGEKLFSRCGKSQQREASIKINVLNKFTKLGMPISKIVAP